MFEWQATDYWTWISPYGAQITGDRSHPRRQVNTRSHQRAISQSKSSRLLNTVYDARVPGKQNLQLYD